MNSIRQYLICNKIFLNYDPIKDRVSVNMTQTKIPTFCISGETFENMSVIDFAEAVQKMKKLTYYDNINTLKKDKNM